MISLLNSSSERISCACVSEWEGQHQHEIILPDALGLGGENAPDRVGASDHQGARGFRLVVVGRNRRSAGTSRARSTARRGCRTSVYRPAAPGARPRRRNRQRRSRASRRNGASPPAIAGAGGRPRRCANARGRSRACSRPSRPAQASRRAFRAAPQTPGHDRRAARTTAADAGAAAAGSRPGHP